MNLFLDINVLQTVPSSNLNRDDTGAPKTAIYGGVMRSRVSSQSWKRAVRQAFRAESQDAQWLKSSRTLKAPLLLANEIQKMDSSVSDEEAMKKSTDIFSKASIKVDNKTNQTKALLLISDGQLKKLAKAILENEDIDKKVIKKIFKEDNSLDLALFGRMVADNPDLNVDAACQVAHAISTHEVTPEFDYFTAVDDEKEEGTAGSAMIGSLEYNSSTLYRYANINLNELIHNIGSKLSVEGIKLFIKNFILTMPTGKENTFANKTLPQYVLITLRDDTPVNLVSAFEEPVKSRDGYVKKSIERLEKEYIDTESFIDKPIYSVVLSKYDSTLSNQAENLTSMIESVSKVVDEKVEKNEDHNN